MENTDLYHIYKKFGRVTTDTRKVDKGDIFFALRGPNFNGNDFAEMALSKGASYAVVDEPTVQNERFVHVENVLKSLQFLAQHVRSTWDFPVIGITGSNGKTTTKELMRDVLSMKFKTTATRGNLNNHIGVPVTILNTPVDTEIAIIEMGANHQGEIRELSSISKPQYGIITNIGKAHLEGFGGEEGVKKGKKELYDSIHERGGKIFVNGNDPLLMEISAKQERIIYGDSLDHLFTIELEEEFPTVSFSWKTKEREFHNIETALSGRYNLQNIAAAIAFGIYFEVDHEKINQAISSYRPQNFRSQLLQTKDNTILMDAYNANPTSMELALKNLKGINSEKKFFVIGDMLELGATSLQEHQYIVDLAKDLGLTGFVVGQEFSKTNNRTFKSFDNSLSVKEYLKENPLKGYTVLLKGSRGIGLEVLQESL